MTRRQFLGLSIAAFSLPAWLSSCMKDSGKPALNFYNWSNYIGKNTIPNFEKETGIRINYELFSDEEEMFAKLKTGVQGYDLAVVTDFLIPRLRALNLIVPIPHDKLKNLGNLEPRFRKPPYDPNLDHSIPYLWGTTGIGYNKKRVIPEPSSWRALWDPAYKGKITMLDNVRDAVGCTLLMLGLPADTGDGAHLEKVKKALIEQKPLLRRYTSAGFDADLLAEESWLCQGWSGDVLRASKENPSIDYAIPKEGSFFYVDSLCMIRGGRRGEETLKFIDYLLRPEVIAEVTNTVSYPNPNRKSAPHLNPGLASDPRVYPDSKTLKRLSFYHVLKPEVEDRWNQLWQQIKVA